jgi:glucokinase
MFTYYAICLRIAQSISASQGKGRGVKRLLGVEMGVDELRWAFLAGSVLEATGSREMPTTGVGHVVDAITRIARAHRPDHLGVAVPARLNRETGVVELIMSISSGPWKRFLLRDELMSRVGCPTSILNDGRAFGTGELLMGAAQGLRNVLFLMLHTGGVGGAYAFEGRILAGATDRMGEFGHLTVDPGGDPCPGCDGRGCLETFASGQSIVRLYRAQAGWNPSGIAEVVAAAEEGDVIAAEILAASGRAVGTAMNSLAGAMPAEAVVIGGDIAPVVLPVMGEEIKLALAERPRQTCAPSLLTSTLGNWAPAVGAALTDVMDDAGQNSAQDGGQDARQNGG